MDIKILGGSKYSPLKFQSHTEAKKFINWITREFDILELRRVSVMIGGYDYPIDRYELLYKGFIYSLYVTEYSFTSDLFALPYFLHCN